MRNEHIGEAICWAIALIGFLYVAGQAIDLLILTVKH